MLVIDPSGKQAYRGFVYSDYKTGGNASPRSYDFFCVKKRVHGMGRLGKWLDAYK